MTYDTLLQWPSQVGAQHLQTLADASFILSLEQGPASWWQAWQQQRLHALLTWTAQLPDWCPWVRAAAPGTGLAKLPVMRREDYRHRAARAGQVPAGHGTVSQHHSSGSAGVPVSFWRSELANRISLSHYWADHRRQGRDLRQRMAVITGTPGPHNGSQVQLTPDPWLQPGEQLARHAPQFSMREHAQWVAQHTPRYLVTTPATLSSLLSIWQQEGPRAPRLEQVLTSSHAVEPELRQRARALTGASIRDRYSCEEVGPLAFQCPHSDDHYHAAVTNVILEVVDAQGQPVHAGAQGSVLVTGLHQWASPALRYELGDVATWHPQGCPACGATVPALSGLLGRRFFLLQTRDQGLRHVRILAEHWLDCAPVREHRVVQTAPDTFRVELVLDAALNAEQHARLQAMLARLVGAEFRFDIVQLSAIAWPSNSKRHEFVGYVA